MRDDIKELRADIDMFCEETVSTGSVFDTILNCLANLAEEIQELRAKLAKLERETK